jgi:hypothetical protein
MSGLFAFYFLLAGSSFGHRQYRDLPLNSPVSNSGFKGGHATLLLISYKKSF